MTYGTHCVTRESSKTIGDLAPNCELDESDPRNCCVEHAGLKVVLLSRSKIESQAGAEARLKDNTHLPLRSSPSISKYAPIPVDAMISVDCSPSAVLPRYATASIPSHLAPYNKGRMSLS